MGIPILFLLSCVLITLPLVTAQQCPNPANFTTNSTYGQNRNRILSSLASNTTANGGFYNSTFTQGSDTIYALALCRGDLSNKSCFDCVNSSTQAIIMNCPNKMEAFDYGLSSHCIVRCSDQSFFNTMTTSPPRFVYITSDITDNVDEFDQALSSLVDSLVIRVTNGSSVGKFATGEVSYTASKYIYGLVQCVPGLSSADCSACIRIAKDYYQNCCFRKRGVNIITPSCIFQYDLNSFYESSAGAAPPPPPLPSSPSRPPSYSSPPPPSTAPPPPPSTTPPPVFWSPPPPSTDVETKGEIFIFDGQECSNGAYFTTNSTYGQNRNRILSSLASNTTANGGFYNSTFTQGSDTIYALALCRGDLSDQSCSDCVDTASQSIIKDCPNQKEAFNYGTYHCIVRCSDRSFFNNMTTSPRFVYIRSDITDNVDEFDQALSSLVDSLVIRVTNGSSVGKFATGEISYTAFKYIYGLVQCLPGLSSADCTACVRFAMNYDRVKTFRKWRANIVTPSCIFEYSFYESTSGAPPPRVVSLSSPSPSTDVGTKGGAEDKCRTIQTTSKNNSRKLRIVVTVVVPTSISLLLIGSTLFQLRIKNSKTDIPSNGDGSIGLPIFNVATIREATNNFSRSNKIGEGGYGPVFKGQLSTGQLIAVKRNSEKSNQGIREFKNEVTFIAKLQHRNLVRLLGCCVEGEERMLIYEYMPNGSLNSFIFENRSNPLAWSLRFDIIVGIARGLLYLHRDSRLRIVHRDLKASNVLLDDQMNPKIADFGLARAFRGDQQLEKTGKVVGTFGYMSPEYVMDGLFSMKSDVYSFGVLVLEIVSGKRNREFFHPDHGLTLLGHAWKLWIEGKALELVHEQMGDFPIPETLKCIQVGLLCVQQHPEDRPTMPSVLLALDSESPMLPQPKQPGFYTERSSTETKPPSSGNQSTSTNEMSLTVLSGR